MDTPRKDRYSRQYDEKHQQNDASLSIVIIVTVGISFAVLFCRGDGWHHRDDDDDDDDDDNQGGGITNNKSIVSSQVTRS